MNLESFNFIKVIGKWAFGKVTLVQKKDTKVLYALKSIEKELLI